MNDIDSYLKEVLERCEAATPGPWRYSYGNWEVVREETSSFICDMHDCLNDLYKSEVDPVYNAEFIAHSRTDVERLAKYCMELREVLEKIACQRETESFDEPPKRSNAMAALARAALEKEIE